MLAIGIAIAANWNGDILQYPLIVTQEFDSLNSIDVKAIQEELEAIASRDGGKLLSMRVHYVNQEEWLTPVYDVVLADPTEFVT